MLKKIYHIGTEEGAATEMYEIDAREALAKFPKEWSDTPWPKSKVADKPKDAAPAADEPKMKAPEEPKDLKPADEPKAPFEAKSKGFGWWAIFDADGAQMGKKMRESDAVAFNAMSDDDKLEYVKAEVAES